MAKLKAGRTAVWVTERSMQILGGAGYVTDHPVERWHRDAKIYDIFEGTEQIQQLVISRAISGLRIEGVDLLKRSVLGLDRSADRPVAEALDRKSDPENGSEAFVKVVE